MKTLSFKILDKEVKMRTFNLRIGDILCILMLITPMMLFVSNSHADTLFGTVVGVTDGDTITLLDGDKVQHTIRLFAIDSPETSCHAKTPSTYDDACVEQSQPFGRAAKKSLSDLVFGKQVNVELQPGSSYSREIGTVWVKNINANLEQVKRGYAWMYRQYAKRGLFPDEYKEMEQAEHEAQEHGLGLWSDSRPTPPWDYRHSR
jgi:endonuclease YncB( thermonuclease family)